MSYPLACGFSVYVTLWGPLEFILAFFPFSICVVVFSELKHFNPEESVLILGKS